MATLIERREYKYLIDEATAERIRHAIAPFCDLDPFAARRPAGRYTIDSLYFDTPSLALYRANEVELRDRFKLRVRTYPQSPHGPVFFEVKSRANDVISKTRGKVPRDLWVELLAAPGARIPPHIRGSHRVAVERFMALAKTYHAAPISVVRYEREPYVSTVDTYARVTFDRHIRSQITRRLSLSTDPRGWRANDNEELAQSVGPITVLELKFTSAVPRWMVNIVSSFDLLRRAFSKYGTSLKTWFMMPTLRTPLYGRG